VQRAINKADASGIPGVKTKIPDLGDTGNTAVGSSQLAMTCTDGCSGDYAFKIPYNPKTDKSAIAKIRRGDTVGYVRPHVSIVYSEKPSKDGEGNYNYEIIHSFSGKNSKYTYPEYDPVSPADTVFARKVMRTWNDIGLDPLGFGRIKLWD